MLRKMLGWLESGEKNAAGIVALCLERIAELDGELRAWVEVAPREALGEGPLSGIPFGVKDIFETRGMATGFGSPVCAGRQGEWDAELVTRLRRRGAILLGKTQTTAFAYFDAAPTRNPRDPRRTPGGSSSGSAAAVAAGMVPFALGSQTLGSMLRPASFCGIAGFKPTYGRLPLEGVMPFAPTLDTAGLFTETAADMQVLWQRGFDGQTAPPATVLGNAGIPRGAAERLRAAGFRVVDVELPAGFEELFPAARLIQDYEGARTHRRRWEEHGDRLGVKMAELVRRGLGTPEEQYQKALAVIAEQRRAMAPVFAEYPVLLTRAATGVAPLGLESTGDPRMNAPWTALGTPAISVPLWSEDGLPLGIQMTAAPDHDDLLLETAARAETEEA